MTRIVGIAGRKGAGKDTAAHVLVEERGYVNVKFAGGIKRIAHAFIKSLGFNEEGESDKFVDGNLKEATINVLTTRADEKFTNFLMAEQELLFDVFQVNLLAEEYDDLIPTFNGTTSREFQQFIGTEIGRNLVGETIWTDAAMREAEKHENVVISDVRFSNEVDVIRAAGGKLIRVERDAAQGNAFSDHPSETAIDTLDVDVVIDNNFALTDLYWSILIAADEVEPGTETTGTGFFK